MAELKLGNIKPVGADNVVVESKYVKGGFIVVSSTTERDALKGNSGENIIEGSLCYCTADSKFYQYNGAAWAEKEFGTTVTATDIAAGLMSAGDKQKLDGIAPGAEVNVQADWDETNQNSDAYIKNKPTIPSIAGLATEGYVNTTVANLVNSAPDTLNTLNELAAALGNDENFATTVTEALAEKASKDELNSLISCGTADPDASITSRFYFKYAAE